MRCTKSEISDEEKRVDGLHKRIATTFATRQYSRKEHRAWSAACRDFHARNSFFDSMMQRSFLDRVISEDGDDRETAITTLEADPCCYWSGYLKGKLIQALKQAELDAYQRHRLWWVIAKMAKGSPRVGFRDYCRLARKVADEELYQVFKQLESDETRLVRNRAKLMLRYLEDHCGLGARQATPQRKSPI